MSNRTGTPASTIVRRVVGPRSGRTQTPTASRGLLRSSGRLRFLEATLVERDEMASMSASPAMVQTWMDSTSGSLSQTRMWPSSWPWERDYYADVVDIPD